MGEMPNPEERSAEQILAVLTLPENAPVSVAKLREYISIALDALSQTADLPLSAKIVNAFQLAFTDPEQTRQKCNERFAEIARLHIELAASMAENVAQGKSEILRIINANSDYLLRNNCTVGILGSFTHGFPTKGDVDLLVISNDNASGTKEKSIINNIQGLFSGWYEFLDSNVINHLKRFRPNTAIPFPVDVMSFYMEEFENAIKNSNKLNDDEIDQEAMYDIADQFAFAFPVLIAQPIIDFSENTLEGVKKAILSNLEKSPIFLAHMLIETQNYIDYLNRKRGQG